MPSDHSSDPAERPVISPFADTEAHSFQKHNKSHAVTWIIIGVCLLVILGAGGFFLFRYLNDPLRTLEPFPVAKYLDSYKSLAGSKFRANLRVENDLGWKEGVGRLMVFMVKDDPHPIVVLVPPSMAQVYFTKGQNYVGELEVKEGGLIYANSCRKD